MGESTHFHKSFEVINPMRLPFVGKPYGESGLMRHGFTLIQMSVVVVVLGLLSTALLPESVSVIERGETTSRNVARIQQAMEKYMRAHGSIPCPAVPFRETTDASYGVAATSGLSCDATNLLNNGNTFIGSVPVKTLSLPYDAALDGFGRRLTYAVDGRATSNPGCLERQALKQSGALEIRASAAGATRNRAMWLLLSHGRDGHGGYAATAASGATLESRLNSGAAMTDEDTLTNANVDASFVASVDGIFVEKGPTLTFDDSVWVDPRHANTCALGDVWKDGYYFTMEADANHDADTSRTAMGDINGDGYDDIVVGAPAADYNTRTNSGSVYVLFGGPGNFVSPVGLASTGTLPTRIRIDGAAAGDAIGASVAVGDINGDRMDDVIISSTAREWVYVLFGRASWSSNTDISSMTGGTMTTGFRFNGSTGEDENIGTSLAVADVNRDGNGDIIAGAPGSDTGASNGGAVYVIFGRTTAWAAATRTIASDLTLNTHYVKHTHATASGAFGTALAAGDVNGDGFADVVASSPVNGSSASGPPTLVSHGSAIGTGSVTVAKPAGIMPGDLLYAIAMNVRTTGGYNQANVPSCPSGFVHDRPSPTEVWFSTGPVTGVAAMGAGRTCSRIADGSEPTSFTSHTPLQPTPIISLSILVVRNGQLPSSLNGMASLFGTNTVHNVSVTGPAFVIRAFFKYASDIGTPPAGWTTVTNAALSPAAFGVATLTQSAVGPVNLSATFGSMGNTDSRGRSMYVRIAPGSGAPTTFGEVNTIFGKASPTSVTAGSGIAGADGFRLVGKDGFGSQVGSALAVGDMNGDKRDDIIIGAPNSTIATVANAGIMHVVYGQAFGSSSYDLDNLGIVNGTTGFYVNGTVANQLIGKSMAVTDLNSDGFGDIAFFGAVDGSNNLDTRVIWGRNTTASPFAAANAVGTLLDGTNRTNGLILRRTGAGLTANHLTSGDHNRDRFGDLIIPFTNTTRRSYVVYGRDTTLFEGISPATPGISSIDGY